MVAHRSSRARLAALVLFLALLPGALPARAAEERVPHGVRFTEAGQTVLVLHGTHRERGEALGRLAGPEILGIFADYGLRLLPPEQLSVLRAAAPFLLAYPDWARQEAEGVIAGMRAAGTPTTVAAVGRDLDAFDLLLLTAIPDSAALACSSLSAWGPATSADPALHGAPVLARNLDFTLPPRSVPALRAAQAVVVHVPTEPGEQPWLSVGLLGFLGALSGIDQSGRGAFLNQDVAGGSTTLGAAFGRGSVPTALALREGLERRDVDGDGQPRLADLAAAFRAHPRVGAVLIHSVARDEADPRALVIEADAAGVSVRRPDPGADWLVATNHARERRPPDTCRRYDQLARGAAAGRGQLGSDDIAALLARVAFRRGPVRTLETMVYEPAAGRIGVGFLADPGHAGGAPLVWHTLAALVRRAAP